MTNTAALDVGGANLKLADGLGLAVSEPFALWQRPAELTDALRSLLAQAPPVERLALTMTGELCDCYATKREGVLAILEATLAAAGSAEVVVYSVDGAWLTPDETRAAPLSVAASNWRALAAFAGGYAIEGTALCLDVGSTTSDLIPLRNGIPAAQGRTDPERMANGELVYTGVVRTPLAMVCPALPWRRRYCPTAHELFATMLDVYLLLDELPENASDLRTADGRPATKEHAWDRLARSICADRETFGFDEATAAARTAAQHQERLLLGAAHDVSRRFDEPFGTIVVSGQGEFLARRVAQKLQSDAAIVSLTDVLGPKCSEVAPAHALAVLTREAWAE